MNMILQWLVVALIGLGAVYMLARHFGLGQKKGQGCPGCGACEAGKRVEAKRA